VKSKILELIQVWSYAFRNEPQYKVVQETFNSMKAEGVSFPALKESDAMFTAEKAPDWRDGECCHRCRVQFSTFQRKHHCRACGQVFCKNCSSKASIIPKFGIEKEVRVCESCYEQINKMPAEKKSSEEDLPAEYLASSLSKQPQVSPSRSAQEIQEEEELQLALALSQSEAEAKTKERQRMKSSNFGQAGSLNNENIATHSQQLPQLKPSSIPPTVMDTSDMDPELARYLNRNYWQQKSIEIKGNSGSQPSAPVSNIEAKTSTIYKEDETHSNGDMTSTNDDREQFLRALHSSIEILVNRMKSDSLRGRSIANDSSVQTLFMTLNAMHPQLVSYIQEQEEKRAHYESLQDKLTQLKDARDALDVLRQEHMEKKRRELEEMERLRQIQMVQKLEVLRQKKQEYLEYQRQLALQRMQEQEMEMRRRLEQQKQDQQMRAMQYSYPQVFAPVAAAYGPPADGSPLHHPHLGPSAPATYSMNQPAMPGSMNAPSGMIQMSAAVNQSGIEYGIAPGYQMQPQSGVYIGPPVGYPHGAPMQANVYGMGSTGTDGQPYSNQGLPSAMIQQQVQPATGEYMVNVNHPIPGQYASHAPVVGPPPQPNQNQQHGQNESALINFD
jgi:growth factor-regulated tyrosine kinase substrate